MEPNALAGKIGLTIAAELLKKIISYSKDQMTQSYEVAALKISDKVAEEIAHIDKVRTLWTKGKSASIKEIYYPIGLSSKDTLELFSEDRQSETIDNNDILNKKSVIIKGIVGQGKSFHLRYLAVNILEKKGRIPIFIELMKITNENTVRSELSRALENYGIHIDEASKKGKNFEFLKHFTIFLDGFDEVNSENVKKTLLEIESLVKIKETNIYITTRPGTEILKTNSFKQYSIKKLTKNDYDGFIEKLKQLEDDTKLILKAKITDIPPQIREVISTPLMLTLFVMVYLNETTIPDNISEFYSKLFNTVFSRHDNLKAGFSREKHCNISESKLLEFFECFSFISKKHGFERTLNNSQFTQVFRETVIATETSISDESHFRKDIANGTNLMLDDGFDTVSYTHRSLQEYYSATFIKKCTDTISEKFYNFTSSNFYCWSEVIRYLSEIDTIRFSKYFAIPAIEQLLTKIEIVRNMQNEKNRRNALTEFLEEYIGETSFELFIDENYIVSLVGFDRGNPKPADERTFFFTIDLLTMPYFRIINPLDDTTTQKYKEVTGIELPKSASDSLEIQTRTFLKQADYRKISGLIELIYFEIEKSLRDYKKIVSLDNSKIKLFEI